MIKPLQQDENNDGTRSAGSGNRSAQTKRGATTLLFSLDGSAVPMVFKGARNKERFREYLRNYLVLNLRQGDMVVIDHLVFHKAEDVSACICSAGTEPLELPLYNPDLNPIKKM